MKPFDPADPDVLPRIAQILRAMGDPVRLRILLVLQQGEHCVSDLVARTGATQTNVSKHLMVLRAARLVSARKVGLRVFYSIADAGLNDVCEAVCKTLRAQLEREGGLRAKLARAMR